jgi:SAM-dependent MidA family methyltransferase
VRDGDVFESRPQLPEFIRGLSAKAAAAPMAALFIDYGHAESALGDTLQAVRKQSYVSPLEYPGESDLTADVDFAELSAIARGLGLELDGPITQSEFLLGIGLAERTQRLMSSARPDQIGFLEAGARRIADPTGMGGRFKAVCIRSRNVPRLPPFVPPADGSNKPRSRRM